MKKWKVCGFVVLCIAGVGALAAAAAVLYNVASSSKPVVYVAEDSLRIHNGKQGRTVYEGYNSSSLSSSVQLSENGEKLFYIAPAGVSGTLYCADTGKRGQGRGKELAANASSAKISPDGSAVVYQNAALELFYLSKEGPVKLDTSVRDVLRVANGRVLYTKYSGSEATGLALFLCSLDKNSGPVQVSDDFEELLDAEDNLSSFHYQTKTPDLGSDPGCHNLFEYVSSRKESRRLLRNVAAIYQIGSDGSVLYAMQGEGGLTVETVLTDPSAETDAKLQPPQPGVAGYDSALALCQQKQLRDAARAALAVQLERAVKLEIFCSKPEEAAPAKPIAAFVGEVSLLEQGKEAAFFSVTDWSGVKLTMEDILTPQSRQAAIARQTAVTFCGVTLGGASVNLCKTAEGLFRKDCFWVDWDNKKVSFLGFANASDTVGKLFEASFSKRSISESLPMAEQVAAVSGNGMCMEVERQEQRQLYSGKGAPIVFDGTVVPQTSVRLFAHTSHCCAAFYPNPGKKKSYTLYSIHNGRANLVSDEAGDALYLRGEKEFLYLEQLCETTGRGRLVLCRPHGKTLQNIQLDTGVSDVLTDQNNKIILTND